MAAFSDLPNELLYDILQFTLPPDIENLAQTSRRVQEVAGPLLKTHRALIRKYYSFSLSSDGRADAVSLLQDILTAPHIAHYVKEAQIDVVEFCSSRRSYTEEEVGWLCEIAAKSKAVIPDSCPAEVSSLQFDIRRNKEDAALGLLLPLLSNLKTFDMEPWSLYSGDRSWVGQVVCNASISAAPWFPKLTSVCLWSERRQRLYHYQRSAQFKHLGLFAALPSVRKLSARELSDVPGYEEQDTPSLASGVTTLELEDMHDQVDPKVLCRFLKDLPRLEVCKLSTSSHPYRPWKFDASMIKDTLLATVKTNLRSLTIFGPSGEKCLMGSLRNFEVLVEPRTNWSFLLQDGFSLQAVLPASLHDLHLKDHEFHRKTKT